MKFFNQFYLDKEKDIIIKLYKENEDELIYILETPNHGTGNLITNLAQICNLETEKDEIYSDVEMNSFTYKEAIGVDMRTFKHIYISFVKCY